MGIFNIILGLILLLFGRKLFWLFVGVLGFIAGIEFAAIFFTEQADWVLLLIGFLTGCLGAILAIFAQRIAFALAGFYAGSFLTLILSHAVSATDTNLLLMLLGGMIGAFLAAWIMDPTLIILSCLVGAGAIVKALDLGQTGSTLLFGLLLATGIFVQTKLFTRLHSD
jgi:MFS family permease